MDELIATVEAIHEQEYRQNKFIAAIQGVQLEDNSEITEEDDITKLKGFHAQQAGFGIDNGLGYVVEE